MDLKELLGEELYNQVMEKAGDKHKIAIVSDGSYIPKEKFDAKNEEVKSLNQQLQERDTQLEELKKIDAEGLQQKIQELQQENETTKTEYEEKLQKQAFEHALENSLAGAKVKNTKAVKALLDMDTIKLDGETLKGLDDQLKDLKESDPYLFDSEEGNNNNGGTPDYSTGDHKNNQNNNDSFASALLGKQ